ncbi:putative ABC-type xenobiotic transporter [Helianthus annuus]|nr:putative ABC-type xenobiotic transporter [Helianthus annuus]
MFACEQVRYRPNTPLLLKGITLKIQGGQKIGVVGRTGGGKSTLIQVMFRLAEPAGGSIMIDGIDISTLGLHDLKSRFGIIPQEPVLFEGIVIGQHSDDEIWKVYISFLILHSVSNLSCNYNICTNLDTNSLL